MKFSHKYTDGSELEVRNLYCIGRNYSEHAKEMGAEVQKDPIVFLKTRQAYFNDEYTFQLPSHSDNMHHEVEMVAVIGKDAHNVSEEDAMSYVSGIGVGIDFTARDVQSKCKEKGHPWTFAKSFFRSAPVSKIIPIQEINTDYFELRLLKNNELVQSGSTSEMIHSLPKLVSYLSKHFYLEQGDCIFTGTPSGVSQVKAGDELIASLDDSISFQLLVK